MHNIKTFLLIVSAVFVSACSPVGDLAVSGISKELATFRKARYSDVRYELSFSIPESKDSSIAAFETVRLTLDGRTDIILDFDVPDHLESALTVNGAVAEHRTANGHLVIPARFTRAGENCISLSFKAGEQSLNRRDEFMYTLLVPARAHTLFPCFDQPDIKAQYTLTLDIPEGWTAVSNTSVQHVCGSRISFAPTEPLSTYLFSFVAGRFDAVNGRRGDRSVTMYHRETDPARIAQCGDILDMVFDSLEYLEAYTAMPYPFGKYDLVVIPDFQYGGMEHTGATLYNDRRMFLGSKPTVDEVLGRASLIAHETAHMWFGDCVTMRWFDDVWTKEVFANWFAARMVRPMFPQVNHQLNDLKNYYASAYDEDRTIGSNAIQRPLDNLSRAGLIYCNIIYDKAPVAMDKLAVRMGEEAFQQSIREYLQTYAYSNADWDDLVRILDAHADFDVAEWSRVWIKEKGMPIYRIEKAVDGPVLLQEDPFKSGNIWDQPVGLRVCGDAVIPNADGSAYGCFLLDEASIAYICRNWPEFPDTERMSLLMTLYENALRGTMPAERFVDWVGEMLPGENVSLISGSLLSYGKSIIGRYGLPTASFCSVLRGLAAGSHPHDLRLQCFRTMMTLTDDADLASELYGIWECMKPYPGLTLGESEYTSLAYQLMIRYPESFESIRDIQAARITNPDRKSSFMFISVAASPDASERQRFFDSLSRVESRRPESRVLTALSLLNHPLRRDEAIRYITPGLELMPEIQRTGDIFFPSSWARTLLDGQHSDQAMQQILAYIDTHPDVHPLLMTKVMQASGIIK